MEVNLIYISEVDIDLSKNLIFKCGEKLDREEAFKDCSTNRTAHARATKCRQTKSCNQIIFNARHKFSTTLSTRVGSPTST